MAITYPEIDPRDEDTIVADIIDDMPAELSDRNASSVSVKLIEGLGAMYGATARLLEQFPRALMLKILELQGVEPAAATYATCSITWTSNALGGTIPAGTIIKTGSALDSVSFATDAELILAPSTSDTVTATAVSAGASGNVPAGTLTSYTPLTGIASASNGAATGGSDAETLAELVARAPTAIAATESAVLASDYAYHAENVSNVRRAGAAGSGGAMTVFVLNEALNEGHASDAATRAAVVADLVERSQPGVIITAIAGNIRLAAITEVEVEIAAGYTASQARTAIVQALGRYITAVNLPSADGLTLDGDAFEYGERLYRNELVSLIDQLAAVERVGDIYIEVSDDYGVTWTSPAVITGYQLPAIDGNESHAYALLHWGATQPEDDDGNAYLTGIDAAGWYTGYSLTITEL